MTTEEHAQKGLGSKKRASRAAGKRRARSGDASEAAGGLTRKQALALWELVLTGDGKLRSKRSVALGRAEVKGLESAGLITMAGGPRKKDPAYGAKMFLTDAAWEWANQQGLETGLARTPIAARMLEVLLGKIGEYLKTHELALDHLLRPRRMDAEPDVATAPAVHEQADTAPRQAEPADLEGWIRAAYLRVTKGVFNEYVRLALLRAELRDQPADAVDAELRRMQQRGGAVLYPIDDPQRIRPEDDAAALRVSGERRDLLCIKG